MTINETLAERKKNRSSARVALVLRRTIGTGRKIRFSADFNGTTSATRCPILSRWGSKSQMTENKFGAPCGTRNHDLPLRRRLHYPAELRAPCADRRAV